MLDSSAKAQQKTRKVQNFLFRWFFGKVNSRRGTFWRLCCASSGRRDIIYNDVRDPVVEFPELQFQAAAAFGTSSSRPENLAKVQSGRNVQFFIRGVRGGWHVALGQVAGIKGGDVYAMMGWKMVDHALSLYTPGVTPSCTVWVVP